MSNLDFSVKCKVTSDDEIGSLAMTLNFLSANLKKSLDDLKELESRGVRILTCGTCLNFYGLSEKLKVGEVTNMYEIVETMSKASLIVSP